ncbi:fructokinase [Undibacterium sp. GrIS 1.8]|uniref:PfkB family carbohydrate kinase n=1 Tax=Undibacterium sp. GrIS 1.8 TaxID=3143934 RepID=UPI003394493C
MSNPISMQVTIFGEVLIDQFPHQKIIGGAPFNVARILGYFACDPLFISRVGQDASAELVRTEMQRFSLRQDGLQTDVDYPTGLVKVEQDEGGDKAQHRFTILPDQAYDYIDAEQASSTFSTINKANAGIMYFGTLAQRSMTSRSALYALLNQTKALKYLDLNLRSMQFSMSTIDTSLHSADVLKLNEDELLTLYQIYLQTDSAHQLNINSEPADWQEAIQILMRLFSLQAVIVTLGARGYAYFDREGRYLDSGKNTLNTVVVDTVGGGDAFSSIYLLGLVQGWSLDVSLRRAHQFAAAICGVRGAVAADLDFYRQWQERWAAESLKDELSKGTPV